MQQYSTQFSGQELNISAWRHIAIGISNRYFNKVFGPNGSDSGDEFDDDDNGDSSLVDSIHDLQAGHGSHIAGLIYARLFGQGELGTMRSREQFRKVSMQWHRFFGFGAEDRIERGLGAGVKRVRSIFDAEREEMQRKRFGKLHRMDVRGQLKQMMGPAAEFRGLQEPVIRAVARGEWPIVQITPTGGGKSLTFMLPAFCVPDGMTIVITPLVALQNDMDARCAKMGIDAYVWTSRGVQRAASLVFVTPESAVTKGFRIFVERMHGQQRLDRVVVDECHTILQYSKTFRPQIGRLGETLQDFGVPVVCLTATLKPTQEKALFKELKFNPDRVRMFREATTRRNIQYRREYRVRVNQEGEEEGEEDDAVEQRVCEIVRAWTAAHEHGKVIIYGGTIKRVERIGAILGCMAYWRGAGNADEKARRIEAWRSSEGGESGWIAATNALGMGIDDPNVRLVVHAGIPRQLVNLSQESGRGGRDGQRSESIVVIRRSEREEAQWAWDDDVVEFAEGKCCRREVLDREMDGSMERFGCIEGEEVCDVCYQQQGIRGEQEEEEAAEADYQRSQRIIRQVETERILQVMRESREVSEFEDILAEWDGCCMVCRIDGRDEAYHSMDECPQKGLKIWDNMKQGIEAVQDEMFAKKQFAKFSACYECGLPQAICKQWEAASDDGRLFKRVRGGRCQYNGLLVRIFVAQRVQAVDSWAEKVGKMMERDGIDIYKGNQMAKLYEWLGGLVEWGGRAGGGIQASRICQVVTRLNGR
ncbi:RecQ helicase [Thelonectria olida]|uniref:DNA 3'-5' helicase n=1 Tax=Thelonectria olida TaxID=1576542 RepID=A0A9P8VP39_9HYPO|nr:RecQ helicase [Thelonectria olida]